MCTRDQISSEAGRQQINNLSTMKESADRGKLPIEHFALDQNGSKPTKSVTSVDQN